MNFHDPLADRIHNGDRHAVARLLVKLGIGIDGGGPVKHIVRKALQPPALTGCQLADASAAERKRRAVFRLALICLLCSLDGQSVFAGIAGAEINAVLVLRVQTKGRFAARLEAPSVLPLVFPVGGEDGTAAIKNTGAFAPVADPDLVIACDQAFGVILLQDFRRTPF
mgnify:CR=1 FL=1